MANTTVVYASIDTNLKESAENILQKLPSRKPTNITNMSRTKFDYELMKGIKSLETNALTIDEVDENLMKEFGI